MTKKIKYVLVARNDWTRIPFVLISLLFLIPGLVIAVASFVSLAAYAICTWPFAKFEKKEEEEKKDS
jgi:ABC-type Fe3+ transport system permease subunit